MIMYKLFFLFLSLFTISELIVLEAVAQEVAGSAAKPQGDGILSILPLFAIVFFIFYFLVLRPQEREMRAHKELIEGLKPGARVLTKGGALGKVHAIDNGEIVLEIANNVRVRFTESAILQIVPGGSTTSEVSKKSSSKDKKREKSKKSA